MKNDIRLKRKFGVDEYGYLTIHKKVSGTQISRILVGEEMGCSHCFPHGQETTNDRWSKIQRNWKSQRKSQYK